MKNNYIPEILKEKITRVFFITYGSCLLLGSILSAIALISFSIDDNSFLTSTSNISQNLLGNPGSYFASFLFYTFGILAYLIVIFLFLYSLLVFFKKSPDYFFIRLLLFFISLVFIPQTLIEFKIYIPFIESIEPWGVFAVQLNGLYDQNYISYIFTILGISIYLFSQSILNLIRIPRVKFRNILKNNNDRPSSNKIKKEPIISSTANDGVSYSEENDNFNNESQALDQQNNYFSPSLEAIIYPF